MQQIVDGSDPSDELFGNHFRLFEASLRVDLAPDNSRIVYATCNYATAETRSRSFHDETIQRFQYEIATSNVDGTEPERLTENTGLDHFPTWSPDGNQIAFIADGSSSGRLVKSQLHTMAADGSDVRNITPSLQLDLYPPAWSPDGQRIALVVDEREEPGAAIYTVKPDGSDLMKISEARSGPSWSPDGTRIAFTKSHEDDGVGLYTVAADGSDTRLVTVMEGGSGSLSPSWSPSGSEILVGCVTMCIINVENGSLVGRSPISLHEGNVAEWSPDGSRIAVLMAQQFPYPNGSIVLYTMARDGTDLRVLVRGGRSLVAESSGWRDIDAGIASCSEGFVIADPKRNPGLVTDCEILMGIRDTLVGTNRWEPYERDLDGWSTGGDLGNVVLNWSPGTPLDQWTGVTTEDVCGPGSSLWLGVCLPRAYSYLTELTFWELLPTFWEYLSVSKPPKPRVTGLDFTRQSGDDYVFDYTYFTGTIPPEIGDLVHLRTLGLSGRWSSLWGHIPRELGKLRELRELNLKGNGLLSGSIPVELGRLENLQMLDLSKNQLTGDMPAALGRLSNLRHLNLQYNGLTGGIPPEFGDLTELQGMRLEHNEITGSIPPDLGGLKRMQGLWLEDNQLTGRVPPELGSITSLKWLDVSRNPLECVPAELVYKADLEIRNNRLETCTADSYSFQVSELAGVGHPVGAVLVTDADTASYSITAGNDDGKFTIEADSGEIAVAGPLDFEAVSSYTLAVEERDRLGATVAATVAITVLSRLEPCSRGIAVPEPGSNPDLVSDCAVLLAVRDTLGRDGYLLNWRTDIPITDWRGVKVGGRPSRVQTLDLTPRTSYGVLPQLSGNISPELGGLTGLWGLDLSGNSFTGGIPSELGRLSGLKYLYLNSNELRGKIPPELGRLSSLKRLYLSYNQLAGEIPLELGRLSGLKRLGLSNNQLTEGIPPELGDITHLEHLYLSGNELMGAIPAELGRLSSLKNLGLGNNQLTGEIPPELGDLSNLEWLRIGGNELTGCIPWGLHDVEDSDLDELGLRHCMASAIHVANCRHSKAGLE